MRYATKFPDVNDVKKTVLLKGYDLFHNSKTSARGVAILIKRNLDYEIISHREDADGNMLLLNIKLGTNDIIIGSVYGPNADNMEFFDNLQNTITSLGNKPVIIGGDWNLTLDTSDPENNIDIINMAAVPSRRRSLKLLEIAENLKLRCPFRSLYPNKREYTYIPTPENMQNRSRLDFFLASESLIPLVTKCKIPHSLKSSVFDHKEIEVWFGTTNAKKNYEVIKNCILTGDTVEDYVHASVVECYVQHAQISENFSPVQKAGLLQTIGEMLENLREIDEARLAWLQDDNPDLDPGIEIRMGRVREQINNLPALEFFENMELTCEKEIFLEVLVMQLKANILSHKDRYFKQKRAKIDRLNRHLSVLKRDFEANR